MTDMADGLDPQETEEVLQIVTSYFRKVTKSEEEAQQLLQALAHAVQDEGAKLVHLGDYVFLVLVRRDSYDGGYDQPPRFCS